MKPLLTILALLMILVMYLCTKLYFVAANDSNRIKSLILDSLRTHHVVKRQNQMILDFKNNRHFYVVEEDNCFTGK